MRTIEPASRIQAGGNDVTLSGLTTEHLKMMAADAEFWASLETNFSG